MEKDMEQTPEETEAGKEPCQEADQETASKAETGETAEGEGTSEKDAEDQPEKKGFFGKKKEKKDKKDQQIEELTDRVKRQMAEFDNYRKRTDKEKAAMFEVGAKSVIEKILPVVDNFERGLAAVPEDITGVTLDIANIEYISSAGLRVVLSLKKRCGKKPFHIINASSEVMDVFEMTGFAEIMDISPACRKISVDGCEVIGRGACGECYRIDDETILKLYYGDADPAFIEHEKSLSKKAFVMGIPTAISYDIVEANGRKGVVYELIKSKTLGELIRTDDSKLDEYVAMYVDICKKVNSIHTNDPEIPSFKEANRADIANVTGITDREREMLYRFIDSVPEGDTCIHGDLNINNIMVQDGECCLIDMGELSTGMPMFDLSRILFSMVYANTEKGEFNSFYKMPSEKVTEIYEKFFRGFFGCDTVEEAEKNNPDVKWLYPLAWFRSCMSMLKGERWGEKMRSRALGLLREKLIPFAERECGNAK